jgi:hypothetical protein
MPAVSKNLYATTMSYSVPIVHPESSHLDLFIKRLEDARDAVIAEGADPTTVRLVTDSYVSYDEVTIETSVEGTRTLSADEMAEWEKKNKAKRTRARKAEAERLRKRLAEVEAELEKKS